MPESNNVHKDNVREVWAIDLGDGHLLPPFDCDPCDEFMAFPSREAAEIAMRRQNELYGLDDNDDGLKPTPVKLF